MVTALLNTVLDNREKEIIDVFLMVDAGVLVSVVDPHSSPHQVAVDNLPIMNINHHCQSS